MCIYNYICIYIHTYIVYIYIYTYINAHTHTCMQRTPEAPYLLRQARTGGYHYGHGALEDSI